MSIGERIKQRRIELGLSQEELAHKLGNKSRASVSTVEHDKEDLTTDRIRKYADALETTPAYLMEWVDDPNWRPPDDDQNMNPNIDYTHGNDLIEIAGKNSDPIAQALELFKLYCSASPEIQQAVEILLRSSKPHS